VSRADRLSELESKTKEYVKKEKTRIENEVQVLEAVLKGRTGGAGVQKISVTVVTAAAENDLASYLKGD
jgi:hypothetical protein